MCGRNKKNSSVLISTVVNKYRVTFVTGSQCQSQVSHLGSQFHDTGVWYYANMPIEESVVARTQNITLGNNQKTYLFNLGTLVIPPPPWFNGYMTTLTPVEERR